MSTVSRPSKPTIGFRVWGCGDNLHSLFQSTSGSACECSKRYACRYAKTVAHAWYYDNIVVPSMRDCFRRVLKCVTFSVQRRNRPQDPNSRNSCSICICNLVAQQHLLARASSGRCLLSPPMVWLGLGLLLHAAADLAEDQEQSREGGRNSIGGARTIMPRPLMSMFVLFLMYTVTQHNTAAVSSL